MGSSGFCLRRGRAAHASPPHQPSGEGGAWGSLGGRRPRRPISQSQTPFFTGIAEALYLFLRHVYKEDDRGREERERREKEDRKTETSWRVEAGRGRAGGCFRELRDKKEERGKGGGEGREEIHKDACLDSNIPFLDLK